VLLLVLTVAVGSSVAAVQLRRALTDAEKAREDSNARLWDSYLTQARALRMSREPGQRFAGLQSIQKALQLPLPPERSLSELRTEAVACLALPDMRVSKEWEGFPVGSYGFDFDAALERYARSEPQARISVHRVADDGELFSVPGNGWVGLSPDGNYLVCWVEATRRFKLWQVSDPNPRIVEDGTGASTPWAFTPDSRQLALVRENGAIDLYDLTTGQHRRLAEGPPGSRPAFDRQGKRLAVACPGVVQIRDAATGQLMIELPHAGTAWDLAWHPDGNRLAVTGYPQRLYLWDLTYRKVAWSAEASRNGGIQVTFSPTGEYLVTNCWSSNLRLWHPDTGQQLLRVPNWGWGALRPHVSPDGRRLAAQVSGTKLRLWEVAPGQEFRTLVRDPVRGTFDYYSPSISPDGRLLAAPVNQGVALLELAGGKELAFLPTGPLSRWAWFEPGGALLTENQSPVELYRWPVTADPAARDGCASVPRSACRTTGPALPRAGTAASWSIRRVRLSTIETARGGRCGSALYPVLGRGSPSAPTAGGLRRRISATRGTGSAACASGIRRRASG
jgi:WD40 repeat protein